jgi:DNA-binding XRE family transcriptional regulator
MSFEDFMAQPEAEAEAQGPEAVAELDAFRLHFSLARQLASRRREQRLTQKQLAALSRVDQAEISRIERGQGNPTTATLGALTRPSRWTRVSCRQAESAIGVTRGTPSPRLPHRRRPAPSLRGDPSQRPAPGVPSVPCGTLRSW